MTSALEEEPEVVGASGDEEARRPVPEPAADEDDTDTEDEEEFEEVAVAHRFKDLRSKIKSGKIELKTEAQQDHFFHQYKTLLEQKTGGTGGNELKNLLHTIVDEDRDTFDKFEALVKFLVERMPILLRDKDSFDRTPLHQAVMSKRYKLIRCMCGGYDEIDSVLRLEAYHKTNIIHQAIRTKVSPKIAVYLIKKASAATLCAEDEQGYTPLHLAVEYDRCSLTQLDVVRALIEKADTALDVGVLDKDPTRLSVYRHHEKTRKDRADPEKEAKDRDTVKAPTKERVSKTEVKAQVGLQAIAEPGMRKQPDDRGLVDRAERNERADRFKVSSVTQPRTITVASAPQGSEAEFVPKPLQRVPTRQEERETHGNLGLRSNQLSMLTDFAAPKPKVASPTTSKTTKSKKKKEESQVTAQTADAIRDEIKLHYMRTRDSEAVVSFLYGAVQDKEIYFDMVGFPEEVSEDKIEELRNLVFEDTLQYVAIPKLKIIRRVISSKFLKRSTIPEGKGRTDLEVLFRWLRGKGVERILQLYVDDQEEPSHSDEAIERCFKDIRVLDLWDWHKADIDAETIFNAAPEVSSVCLHWAGNNGTLRAWSEPDGLNRLKKLKQVTVHEAMGLETRARTRLNLDSFVKRLKDNRELLRNMKSSSIAGEDDSDDDGKEAEKEKPPKIDVKVIRDIMPQAVSQPNNMVAVSQEQVKDRHKWLITMDSFADFYQNVEPLVQTQAEEPITVGLIDDGVDITEQSLISKVIGGRSFCHRYDNLSAPFYVTTGWHGTVMASLISRVCPKVQIYVLKLDEYPAEDGKRQITAKSAAKAVRAAIDRGVDIISMSWTIERTTHNADDIAELEDAIEDAAKKNILLFCAANDQGIVRDDSYPANSSVTRRFKIGAAEASGAIWKWSGDPQAVDFIMPGHNVVKERASELQFERARALTGSSVATALAAGLAALILHCVQFAAQHTLHTNPQRKLVTMEDFKAMKTHERMKEALAQLTSSSSQNKFVEVWKYFESPGKKGESASKEQKREIVTEVAHLLKSRPTFEVSTI